MIALVLIAVIICVTASYVTEYNKNKVDAETIFEAPEEDREYKSAKEFYENFEYFEIYLAEGSSEAYYDQNDSLISGTQRFLIESKKGENYNLRNTVTLQFALGANWIGYTSNVTSAKSPEVGEKTTVTISNIEQIFPAKGNLLFTNVKKPTLYVMVKWTEKDNERYYTYIELKYKEYFETPNIPVEEPTESVTE